MILRVVSRKSPLSLLQVEEAMGLFHSLVEGYELVTVDSLGDKRRDISLMDASIPRDFFTRELDDCLLERRADIGIHSAKDLPYPLPVGLSVVALLAAHDRSDALVSRNGETLETLPAGAHIGTSAAKRREELLKYRPDLVVVPIRGNIEQRIAQVDDGAIDALIVATCALRRLDLSHRISQELPFRTHPLQGHLAIVARSDRLDLADLFAAHDCRRRYGRVTLVGFGPGNPDLLTLGGDRALAEADIIFHDDLVDQAFLNRYPAEKVYVGKRRDIHRYGQEDINRHVYEAAIAGRRTVRLKGGDPMVFAHGREEVDYLRSRLVTVDIVPGITAATAIAAATSIPLTHRGTARSVAFATGHTAESVPTPTADTLVYYMPAANLAAIASSLIAAGRSTDTPAALVHNATLPDQCTFFTTLGELRYALLLHATPLLLLIGDVVAFENRQAELQPALFTGTSADDVPPSITAVHTPLIRTQRLEPPQQELLHALRHIDRYRLLILTSRHAVHYLFGLMAEHGIPRPAIDIATIGPRTTAALSSHGGTAAIQSPTETARGLLPLLNSEPLNILFPRSARADDTFPEALRLLGHTVDTFPLYTTLTVPDPPIVDLTRFSKIFLPSPSAIDAFVHHYGDFPPLTLLIARGPTTFAHLRRTALPTSTL